MEYNEILYYKPTERPELVRIISESLRLDVTIVPKDQDNEFYYASLVELAKCPEIDHIYAWDGPTYCEGDDDDGFCELRGQMVDICLCLDFFSRQKNTKKDCKWEENSFWRLNGSVRKSQRRKKICRAMRKGVRKNRVPVAVKRTKKANPEAGQKSKVVNF